MDIENLKAWFVATKRDLPWREPQYKNPYTVWISEVMLQQTQAITVIPYFFRWLEKFPTLQALANAQIEEVVKVWEGLGYYSRARNLHKGAQLMQRQYQGVPNSREELKKIPGIGDYTSGAIVSFAYQKKAPAVDGNVLRVITRHDAISDDILEKKTKDKVEQRVFSLLPDHEPHVAMEALIELGASVCKKEPLCYLCPLKETCVAYAKGKQSQFPVKQKQIKQTILHRLVFVVEHKNLFLAFQEKEKKVMSGLFQFPYVDIEKTDWENLKEEDVLLMAWQHLGIKGDLAKPLQEVKHTFTRFQARLKPFYLKAKECLLEKQDNFFTAEQLKEKPFSSGHRKILYAHFTH